MANENGMCCATDASAAGGDERAQNVSSQKLSYNKPSRTTYEPALDLLEYVDRYEIHFDVPGVSAGNIDLTVKDRVLTVAAPITARYEQATKPMLVEYGVGDFERRLRLGADIDQDSLAASYDQGVLTVVLPKRAERQPKRVEVRAG
jgi:HSP20 family molecular chaperone IbpA